MERNINVWLPLTWPPLGTWPATQACAMIGNRTATLWFTAHAQSTELHCPGLDSLFKKKKILFISIQRGREGETEGEKHRYVVASHIPPTGDLAHNPGMCPDGN